MIKLSFQSMVFRNDIPTKVGIQNICTHLIPACAGMIIYKTRYALICLVAILLLPFSLSAHENPKARADALYHQLRCVVCAGQSLAESNADMAVQMRHLVRKQLKNGMSDAEILQFFATRYGDEILTIPPVNAFTQLLWCAPVLFLLGGLLIWRLSQRKPRS